jgi:Spy/CpxP family protein refolding chaperone
MMHEWTYGYLLAKRTLLLAGILLVSCGALTAQSGDAPPPPGQMQGRGGGNPERQLQMLTERLSLTADQQTQVKALLADQRQKMQVLRESNSGAPPDRQQMEGIRNETDTKINALLNDDQKAKFAEWQKERNARMGRQQGPDQPPPPPPPQE